MSGKKFDNNKPPISLIPREALEAEANALNFGAKKYGRFNFREGIAYSRLIDAALRHIIAVADGEDLDEESQCFHAANARANLGMLLYMMENKPEMDDRYKKPTELNVAVDNDITFAKAYYDKYYPNGLELSRVPGPMELPIFNVENLRIFENSYAPKHERDRTTGRNRDDK